MLIQLHTILVYFFTDKIDKLLADNLKIAAANFGKPKKKVFILLAGVFSGNIRVCQEIYRGTFHQCWNPIYSVVHPVASKCLLLDVTSFQELPFIL